ncbi:hypothetical protein [Limosilactobacillus agrestimuris]|uniref:hypothetical protein n=1 Tax=Limosilactobacillus agrestimuris TaxID=2941331 RepID=UPI00203A76AA|nr:hypothetical protein [Limosilactobacillus agrestimuris]
MLNYYPDYPYNDGEKTIFFDITNLRKTVGPRMQHVLDLLANRKLDEEDDFIIQLKQRIALVKQNRKWRKEYMQRSLYEMDMENARNEAVKEGHERGLQQGLQQGLQEGVNAVYKKDYKRDYKRDVNVVYKKVASKD